jgi:DNA-binding transcriptional LysR family regulator
LLSRNTMSMIANHDCRNARSMLDWNDLRHVLAVAREGSLAGAAGVLGVNQSTVFRRLNALEAAMGVRLFERLPGGWRPTGPGEQVIRAAERMEEQAIALDRELLGRDHRLEGRLRVTSSETLAYRVLTRQLARFRERHPGIRLELVIDNRMLSLSRREADVALRPTRPREGDLFGRKLADIAWSVYGAPALLARSGRPQAIADLTAHPLIGWDEGATQIKVVEWLATIAPDGAFVYRTSSLVNQLVAARAGIGLAVLPCYLGDVEPELVRLFEPVPELARELWIVTHADLRHTARVRAFLEMVGEGIVRERALLEGRACAG